MLDKPGAVVIEGHVQGLSNLRILAKAGIPTVVVDKGDCIARYSKYCRGFYRSPEYIDDSFADFLLDLAKKENLHGWLLMPSNDHAVYSLAKHQQRLEMVYKFLIPPIETYAKIYDKSRLLTLAQELGIPIPKTAYFSTSTLESVNLSFPVLTKGKTGLSFYKKFGKKAIVAKDYQELQRCLRQIEKTIPLSETFTQEIIPFDGSNRTVSFTAFCVNGEIKTFWMGAKLREHPLQFGTATFCESVFEQACLDHSVPLLRALNYTGVCEIEYLRDPRDGQFKLIELNARTWLWVGLAAACGVEFPLYVYNYVNGIPSIYPTDYPVGMRWRNFWTDTVFSMQAILTGKLRVSEYLKSLQGEGLIDAVRDKDDPSPFRIMTLCLPKLLLQR
jgi:predicted ATP-grasp superfamily ATP-dependent carboligase